MSFSSGDLGRQTFCSSGRLALFRQELAKSLVYGRRIMKDISDVRFKQDYIRTLLIPLIIFATDTTPDIVFGPHLVAGWFITRLLHMHDVLRSLRVEHR